MKNKEEFLQEIRNKLFAFEDLEYKKFNSRLIPNVEAQRFIGVRMPMLKSLAKELLKENPEYIDFYLMDLPHFYYEENQLHGQILGEEKDFDKAIKNVESFLPFMDNWAITDGFVPKAFRKNPDKIYSYCEKWVSTGQEFVARYGINLMMRLHLKSQRALEAMELVSQVETEKYYLKMMIAWFFAEALLWQEEATLKILEEKSLEAWIHNKAIQKACESKRVTQSRKEYIRTLKV